MGQIELELAEIYCLSLNVESWLLLPWDVKIQNPDSWKKKLNSEPGVMMVRAISAEQLFLLWLGARESFLLSGFTVPTSIHLRQLPLKIAQLEDGSENALGSTLVGGGRVPS